MQLSASELILNEDKSIYHLNLLPSEIATTIITVGDPDRVALVSSFFDSIEVVKQKREFLTHTGIYKSKRITVISTGIGTDNIDIVLNELDALVNIDFESRTIKPFLTSLNIIRIGTSGAIQPDIPVDSILISKKAIGVDALLHFYKAKPILGDAFSEAFCNDMEWHKEKSKPYTVEASNSLLSIFEQEDTLKGVTLTNVGFYGPQARTLRLLPSAENFHKKLQQFEFRGERITNLEMETSAIYGLSKLLGHKAISINCILANRATSVFSKSPEVVIRKAIQMVLNKIVSNNSL